MEPKVAYDVYLVRKIPFGENEFSSSDNFPSGCEILRLGALAEKMQLAAWSARITLRETEFALRVITGAGGKSPT